MLLFCGLVLAARASEFKNERQLREEREERDKQRRYVLPDLSVPLNPPHLADDVTNTSLTLPSLNSRPVLPSRVRFVSPRRGSERGGRRTAPEVTSSLSSQSTVSLPVLQRGFTIQTVTQRPVDTTVRSDVKNTAVTSSLTQINVERANRAHKLNFKVRNDDVSTSLGTATTCEKTTSSKRSLRHGRTYVTSKKKRKAKSKAGLT